MSHIIKYIIENKQRIFNQLCDSQRHKVVSDIKTLDLNNINEMFSVLNNCLEGQGIISKEILFEYIKSYIYDKSDKCYSEKEFDILINIISNSNNQNTLEDIK